MGSAARRPARCSKADVCRDSSRSQEIVRYRAGRRGAQDGDRPQEAADVRRRFRRPGPARGLRAVGPPGDLQHRAVVAQAVGDGVRHHRVPEHLRPRAYPDVRGHYGRPPLVAP